MLANNSQKIAGNWRRVWMTEIQSPTSDFYFTFLSKRILSFLRFSLSCEINEPRAMIISVSINMPRSREGADVFPLSPTNIRLFFPNVNVYNLF